MKRFDIFRSIQKRCFSAEVKIDEAVDTLLQNNELKHRKHPGIIKSTPLTLPDRILNGINLIFEDKSLSKKLLYEYGKKLACHLHGRHPPVEHNILQDKINKVEEILNSKYSDDNIKTTTKEKMKRVLLQQNIYNWKATEYDRKTSIAYLVNRSVPEYVILRKIFNEIKNYNKDFLPKTLFDFGSGVGTVMWAASETWLHSLVEYNGIDISNDMIDLSEKIMKGANIFIRSVSYRQYLSPSHKSTYDIVVSAYTLLELPNAESRFKVILNLWKKTEHYLVFVEQGTNAGFQMVTEARSIILSCTNSRSNQIHEDVYTCAPCPHDLACPRYASDNTPCNFEATYLTLPISGHFMSKRERFSYVIFKKGKRPEDDKQWPRIVRPILKRSKHVICRMCTAAGKIEEEIFTKNKHGKNIYRCARVSKWGDQLPIKIEKPE